MATPWSTEVNVAAPEPGAFPEVRISLFLSTEPGPTRKFRQFLEFDLDEPHAHELLGELAIALKELRDARRIAEDGRRG